ncbi:phage tail assembly chaperone [Prosthecomicrobium sp. N25]|uniref:phage tail assembly chaperone n=1 Tax=Prosthecomicrobium sp. N25 TaxID=3129254 RepID=UPI0030770CD5
MAPAAFWALTPRELAALLAPLAVPGGPGRDGLAALLRDYPDGRPPGDARPGAASLPKEIP